jgi:GNAT superfamily N-acetyltransferase
MPVKIYCPTLEAAKTSVPPIIKCFIGEINFPFKWNNKSIEESIEAMWDASLYVLAEKDGFIIGGMQSIIAPHIWNREVLSSQEIFFYVKPTFRGGSTAYRMLRFHEEQLDKRKVNIKSLCTLETSPKGVRKSYQKMGYSLHERTFIKMTS